MKLKLEYFKTCMDQCYTCKYFVETGTGGYCDCSKNHEFLNNCPDYEEK